MAFQTNVLKDGTWVTEDVDVQSFLAAKESLRAKSTNSTPPECGILTRTVVESPVAQWILPVRLRSAVHNDVAFIGERYVQIREFKSDSQLHDVARKTDLGGRIKNAQVLGSFYEDSTVDQAFHSSGSTHKPLSRADFDHLGHGSSRPKRRALPPQMLVLALEGGQLVFLFLRPSSAAHDMFVSFTVKSPRKGLMVHPGFHLATDPTSRYVVASSCEGLFVVYELPSYDTMAREYETTGTIGTVATYRPRVIDGIILKIDFLFPDASDGDTVILVLLVRKLDSTRMITYEWTHGDDLTQVFSEEKPGHRLPQEHSMPLLLIPLTVKSSFLSVSEDSIAVFRDVLQGSSTPELVNTTNRGPTAYHHGRGRPLWTAWTRPLRRKAYYGARDNIYLAREDGIVLFFEIDSDGILDSSLDVGDYSTNIATAFATVADSFNDILILGGSFGDGSIWALPARERPEQIGVLPNWSPVLDVTTTDAATLWDPSTNPLSSPAKPWRKNVFGSRLQCDRIFTTSGSGINGSITEFMMGAKANVSLDVEYGSPLNRVWVLRVPGSATLSILLGLHNESAVVQLAPDLGDLEDPNLDLGFDTSARTLAATHVSLGATGECICQVTEASVTIISPTERLQHTVGSIIGAPHARAENACIRDQLVAFSSSPLQPDSSFRIFLLSLNDEGRVAQQYDVHHEVTCLEFCTIGSRSFVVAATWQLGETSLSFYSVDGPPQSQPALVIPVEADPTNGMATQVATGHAHGPEGTDASLVEAVTSLVVVFESTETTILVCGTRGGYFVRVEVRRVAAEGLKATVALERFGILPVEAFPAKPPTPGHVEYPLSVFACCDSGAVLLGDYDARGEKGFAVRHRILAVDNSSKVVEHTQISAVSGFPGAWQEDAPVVLLTGSRLLVARLGSRSEVVPRRMDIGMAPRRVIYSQALECLVVAATFDNKPTLVFLDPDTGKDISWATGKDKEDLEYISGLGLEGDWIHCLHEWFCTKDGKTFYFFLLGTDSGRLITVSTERVGDRIRFWTRHKRSPQDSPIYSVFAAEDDTFYSTGAAIHWEVLDGLERKIREHAIIPLVSPATSITLLGRKLYVVTHSASLQVIDLDAVEATKESASILGEGLVEQRARPTLHMMDVGDSAEGPVAWPLTLLSDQECGVIGAWVPRGPTSNEFTIVVEAELPASVRRFRRGHTRPVWWRSTARQRRYGRIPSTTDDAEILGACLDGSLQHFTLLGLEGWRFLRLVQNVMSRHISPLSKKQRELIASEPRQVPKTQLHVDGDVLRECVEMKALRRIFNNGADMGLFMEYLDELDGGQWTEGFRAPGRQGGSGADENLLDGELCDDGEGGGNSTTTPADKAGSPHDENGSVSVDEGSWGKYLELGYDVLEYFLTPVL